MKGQSGFTLIELIMVIVILGVLAAVAVPKFIDLSSDAEASACKSNQAAIESAASLAYADSASGGNPVFPSSLSGALFANGEVPDCPSPDGDYTYDSSTGTVTCSVADHARN